MSKKDVISEAIDNIDDRYLADAASYSVPRKNRYIVSEIIGSVAAVAAIAVFAVVLSRYAKKTDGISNPAASGDNSVVVTEQTEEGTESDPQIRDERISALFRALANKGWYDGGEYRDYEFLTHDEAEYINVTTDEIKEKMPAVTLIKNGTALFVMKNDTVYNPLVIQDGSWSASLTDYNNDGVTDMLVTADRGSITPRLSGYILDMKTNEFIPQYTEDNIVLPDDFSFSIVWDYYGISSYDSKTGKLIKTYDTADISKYTATYNMTEEELLKIYKILFYDIDIREYPDEYDPYNPSDKKTLTGGKDTVIIKATANGEEKTVECRDIVKSYKGTNGTATAFVLAKYRITSILTSTPEWKALPANEVSNYGDGTTPRYPSPNF